MELGDVIEAATFTLALVAVFWTLMWRPKPQPNRDLTSKEYDDVTCSICRSKRTTQIIP